MLPSRAAILCLDHINIKSVFDKLRVSLLTLRQAGISLRLLLILFCKTGRLVKVKFVSLANNLAVPYS